MIGEWLIQLVDATKYLHDNFIFHSYINPREICIKNVNFVKLGGFYQMEKFESKDDKSSNSGRKLFYYNCSPNEKQNLGLKYDIWYSFRSV